MWSGAKTVVWYLAILVVALLILKFISSSAPNEGSLTSTQLTQRGKDFGRASGVVSEKFAEKKKIFNPERHGYFLRVFDKENASPGMNLIPTSGSGEIALLDMKGKVLHKWDVDAARARLLPNGHILVIHGSPWGEVTKQWGPLMSTIREYDWDGDVVWQYKSPEKVHHDLRRLENGNTLFLREISLPDEIRQQIRDPLRRNLSTITDEIVEVTSSGTEVFSWKFFEHFDINSCGLRPCAAGEGGKLKPKTLKDWSHTNSLSELGPNKWYDSGDNRFHPRNLLILPRRFWTPMIIERETGNVVWKYEEREYRGGLGAPHEVQMIPQGLPGEGNILVLDNGPGTHAGQSFVLEINPVSKKVEWAYDVGNEFYNKTRGSVQRLENGNTLISWDREGRLLEVNTAGKTLWEIRVPSELSRARRYPLSYCKPCLTKASHT